MHRTNHSHHPTDTQTGDRSCGREHGGRRCRDGHGQEQGHGHGHGHGHHDGNDHACCRGRNREQGRCRRQGGPGRGEN